MLSSEILNKIVDAINEKSQFKDSIVIFDKINIHLDIIYITCHKINEQNNKQVCVLSTNKIFNKNN